MRSGLWSESLFVLTNEDIIAVVSYHSQKVFSCPIVKMFSLKHWACEVYEEVDDIID